MTIKFWKCKLYCREILLSWRRLLITDRVLEEPSVEEFECENSVLEASNSPVLKLMSMHDCRWQQGNESRKLALVRYGRYGIANFSSASIERECRASA